jgi:hypothetical protein
MRSSICPSEHVAVVVVNMICILCAGAALLHLAPSILITTKKVNLISQETANITNRIADLEEQKALLQNSPDMAARNFANLAHQSRVTILWNR